jgi:hypothetical protein
MPQNNNNERVGNAPVRGARLCPDGGEETPGQPTIAAP